MGQNKVILLSRHINIGGVWRTRQIFTGCVEAFPHVIEFSRDSELKNYEAFFNCEFIRENKHDVVFWYRDCKFQAADRLDSFKLALWQYTNSKDKSKFKRNLSHVLRPRSYCIPRLGFTKISDGLKHLCSKYDIQTIQDEAEEISVSESGAVKIKGRKNEYRCQNLYIPRGLSDVSVRTPQNNFKFESNRMCRVDYVEARSNVLSRYNKFLDHYLIDRIAKINSSIWIIQSKFDLEKNVLNSEYYLQEIENYLLRTRIFSEPMKSLHSSISSAASFNISDIAFADTSLRLPENVKIINSKALSYLL